MGCISLLQIPRTLIKFWQVYIKPLIITYEQSGKELNDISQPEPFEVSTLLTRSCHYGALTLSMVCDINMSRVVQD